MTTLARFQRSIQDEAGAILAGASVEVRSEASGSLAALFSDRAGTAGIANPVTADADGLAGFYVAGGAYKITVTSGALEIIWRYVGIGTAAEFDGPAYKYLDADEAGADVDTAQPWFPTAGALSVKAGTVYRFKGLLRLSRAAGTTPHTTAVLFGGTATLTSIDYVAKAKEGDANDLQDVSEIFGSAATALVVKASSSSATEQSIIEVEGILKVNAAGTLIPQYQYSAAPGGVPTNKRGTYFELRELGTAASAGTWA